MSNEYSEEISQQEWETIEAYLLKNMSDEEYAGFEKLIAGNEDWNAKITTVKVAILGIREAAMKDQVEVFHRRMPELVNTNMKPVKRVNWLVAAGVLAVLSISMWLVFFSQSKEDRIYAAYYQPDPGLPTYMAATDNYEFEKAMVEYKSGNYKTAIEGWEKLLTQQPQNDTLTYFLGNAYMAAKNYTAAIKYYDLTLKNEKSLFTQDVWWYLGLCYIKENDIKNAMRALTHSEKAEATAIINELAK